MHAERVSKLVFIAPVVDYAEGKALFSLAKVPVVAEWYARVFAVRRAVNRATYSGLGEQPKLLIWGNADLEIPKAHIGFLRAKLENLTYVEIEGAGHGVAVQARDEVNRRLVAFLTGTASRPSR